ncbi:hypothetical protein EPUS_05121 [Endocarpon pusillum Z07020]|uniref:Uncharacterized protein n=1 Tax=Endocarpon pusillum (strain Z07020 / HMAS-L-300199) TaxID=1263415 RepID=U1HP04_ENDPU|nr:uncharacterized protein EPUS_05121 [Endocarpon pusillum Z07020]ERF70769.1 hypothetical protein EPUS_05121 [Endocarpon pusillum Z07020]
MAAPFGLSLVDLTKAIQLAREIYLKCYTEDQGANHKYREFVQHINTLRSSLQRLQEGFRKYEKQYPRREWHSDPYNTDAADALWPQLTGDFHQTLKECESLLSRHGYLQNGRTTATSNLRWWLSAEGAVDNLMAKLRLHITMVDFYAKPAEFEAFIRNGTQIQQMRRQLANLERVMMNGPGSSPALWECIVSIELKAKLEAELQACPPVWLKDGSSWPLEEGFRALTFHFARGTIHFNPTPQSGKIPELQQYLNLAKSTWILEKLKESNHFKATSTESIWADYMRELEDDLKGQVHRFETGELGKLPAHSLLVLASDAYAISQGEEVNPDPLDAGKAGPIEEKILEIDLSPTTGNRECALLVFRESDADFRLVTSMRQADTLVALYDKEVELNMARNRLVPAYASPAQGLSPRYNLLLLNEKGKKAKEFAFESPEDVQKLQRALTGYRVHHDMPVARWCINGSKEPGNYGQGILQLWQFKPLPALLDPNSSEGSDSSSLLRIPTSNGQNGSSVDFLGWEPTPSTPFADAFHENPSSTTSSLAESKSVEAQNIRPGMTVLSSTTRTSGYGTPTTGRKFSKAWSFTSTSRSGSRETQRHFSIASGKTGTSRASVMTPVQGPRGRGTEFVKPELPALILFTKCNARYTFLHLTLDPKIHINPTACKCRNERSGCKRVVIESKNPCFTMRVLTADQKGDDGINSWDLSVFRYPRTEKWQQAIVNDRVKTLELEFATVEERILFVDEVTSLENVRTTDHNEYQEVLRQKTTKKEKGRG